MVSLDLLRRHQLGGCLEEAEQEAIAAIAEERVYAGGSIIFAQGQPAESLYLLLEGQVDLCCSPCPDTVQPADISGMSVPEPPSLIGLLRSPEFAATAMAVTTSRVLRIDTRALSALCETNAKMNYMWLPHIRAMVLSRRAGPHRMIIESMPARMTMGA